MADGKNDARAFRVLDLASDFRTLQVHIQALQSRITPPDPQSQAFAGYTLARQLSAQAQSLIAHQFDRGSVPQQPSADEAQKASLQRMILDMSCRRWRAHKIYLNLAAVMRWIQMRNQILQGKPAGPANQAQLQAVDQRLRQEITDLTDKHIFDELRKGDRRKDTWIDEDPTLERILAWVRTQQ